MSSWAKDVTTVWTFFFYNLLSSKCKKAKHHILALRICIYLQTPHQLSLLAWSQCRQRMAHKPADLLILLQFIVCSAKGAVTLFTGQTGCHSKAFLWALWVIPFSWLGTETLCVSVLMRSFSFSWAGSGAVSLRLEKKEKWPQLLMCVTHPVLQTLHHSLSHPGCNIIKQFILYRDCVSGF